MDPKLSMKPLKLKSTTSPHPQPYLEVHGVVVSLFTPTPRTTTDREPDMNFQGNFGGLGFRV